MSGVEAVNQTLTELLASNRDHNNPLFLSDTGRKVLAIREHIGTLRARLEAAEARHAATERDACQQAERANDYRDRCLAALERAAAAEAECARLRSAGTLLANCAFNLAQRSPLSDYEKQILDTARREWDAASTKEQQA